MNDIGMIAPCSASHLVNLFKPENKSQFKILKDSNSVRKNDFWINTSVPVTLFSNMLSFRDTNKSINLDGDFLETVTNYDFKVNHSNPQDQKVTMSLEKKRTLSLNRRGEKVTETNLP